MRNKSKRMTDGGKNLDTEKTYGVQEAIEILKSFPTTKFDQTVEVSLSLGVDPKKADQQVRSTVSMPHGTGRSSKVLVFAKGDKAKEAEDAGADYVGDDELAEKIMSGWFDFTAVVATPDMMRVVGKLGKVLGPRGLMPAPKAGTVTVDVKKAVQEIKAGKIEFKVDKASNMNTICGKLSFSAEQLEENLNVLLDAIIKCKPQTCKGQYIKSMSISSTMGPGMKFKHKHVQMGN